MHVPGEIAGEDIDKIIQRLLGGQLYGVLCTQGQGQTYGSLVAYAMTPDLSSAVFATQKATRKYNLLAECAHVALVIDNRSAAPGQLMEVEAVTATGSAHEVATGPAFEDWSRLLIARHAYLDPFVRSASCALFRVEIGQYLHVTRFQEVRLWVPTGPA